MSSCKATLGTRTFSNTHIRWADDVKKFAGKQCKRVASDIELYDALKEAYTVPKSQQNFRIPKFKFLELTRTGKQ